MKIAKTKYIIDDNEEYEDLFNELFIGLEQYKRTHIDFTFKIIQDKESIEIKTFTLDESVN